MGGTITTEVPKTWWKLFLEVEYIEGLQKTIMVGLSSEIGGDLAFDPMFRLRLELDLDGRITGGQVLSYESTTILGTIYSEEDNILHGFGRTEKGHMKEWFSSFMQTVIEVGPYVSNPKKITRYNKTLAD